MLTELLVTAGKAIAAKSAVVVVAGVVGVGAIATPIVVSTATADAPPSEVVTQRASPIRGVLDLTDIRLPGVAAQLAAEESARTAAAAQAEAEALAVAARTAAEAAAPVEANAKAHTTITGGTSGTTDRGGSDIAPRPAAAPAPVPDAGPPGQAPPCDPSELIWLDGHGMVPRCIANVQCGDVLPKPGGGTYTLPC